MTRTLTLTFIILATCSLLASAAPTVIELETQARSVACAIGTQQPLCSSCGGENISTLRRGFCRDRNEEELACPCCPRPEKGLDCSTCGGPFVVTDESGLLKTICVGLQEERWSYHGCACTPGLEKEEEEMIDTSL